MSKKVSNETHNKEQLNHHSEQSNTNNAKHQESLNNHANQLNPNNKEYKGKK